jgi:hypothetical protein
VLEQRSYLYEIEQKYLSKKELQSNEEEIRTNMLEFQSIRSELELYVNTHSRLSSRRERELLYKLLTLSNWLTKYFLGE